MSSVQNTRGGWKDKIEHIDGAYGTSKIIF